MSIVGDKVGTAPSWITTGTRARLWLHIGQSMLLQNKVLIQHVKRGC